MIRIGIVGLGFMAVTHIRAWRQLASARIAAVCNPSGRHLDGRFEDVAGNVGSNDPVQLDMTATRAFRDFAALLADPEVQVIDICSPTFTHCEFAIAALQAGKHVLCEKPLARTTVEARRIAEVARSAQTFLMPAMCMRFWPGWSWLQEAVTDGRYGRVLAARFRRVAEPPGWGHSHFADGRKSGGALLDLHIHDSDFVQFLFGMPAEVRSAGYACFSGAIDHIVTHYVYPGGPMVHAEGAWSMTPGFGFNMAYTVVFESATADYDLSRSPNPLRIVEKGRAGALEEAPAGDGYAGEARYLADCIESNRTPSIVTPEDGVRAVALCEAEEASVSSGKPVGL